MLIVRLHSNHERTIMKALLLILALVQSAICAASTTESRFYQPIRNNDLPALRKLIRGIGVKTRDADGNTALLYAAAVGSAESMRLLLIAGADPNAANRMGATPLMWSAGDLTKV